MAESSGENNEGYRLIKPDEVHEYLATRPMIWRGYCEAVEGTPFDPDAYADDEAHAMWYEEGRCFAIEFAAAHSNRVPQWTAPYSPPFSFVNWLARRVEETQRARRAQEGWAA